MSPRKARVVSDFKAGNKARCEVCKWRPPEALREVAGGVGLLHGHHVVPVACGGADHPDNLILVCPTCHTIAHRMGTMVPVDGRKEWWGPQSPAELRLCFAVLSRPKEYARLKGYGHSFTVLYEHLHAEALEMNTPTRGLSVLRGGVGLRGAA